MPSLADYGLIAGAVKDDVITPQQSAIDDQQLRNLALGNRAQEMKLNQAQKQLDTDALIQQSIQKNGVVDPATGQVKINHAQVAADLANSGHVDKAYEYMDQQHTATYQKHAAEIGQIAQLAQGVLSQPEEVRPQAYQAALMQAKQMGIDTTGAPPQYDPNYLTGIINSAVDAKTHFEGSMKQQTEARKAESDAAHIESENKRTDAMVNLSNARAGHLTIADSGSMAPEDIDFYGEQYAKGDPSVIRNMSKVDAAAIRSAARKYIANSGGNADTAMTDRQDQAAISKSIKDFSTGKQGNTVRSFNTALEHIDTLNDSIAALENGDINFINKAKNYYQKETGNPAQTNFDATKKIVADELVKAIVGAGGGVTDREEAAKVIDKQNSSAQLRGVIAQYEKLMHGQLEGLEEQYKSSTNRDDFADKYLTKRAKEVRQRLRSESSSKNPASLTPPSGSAPAQDIHAQADAILSGVK